MEAHSGPKPLKICFMNQDGDKSVFIVKPNAKVMNLLKKYCAKKQLDYKTVNFVHDGRRLTRRGSIQEVGLKDEDEIFVDVAKVHGG